MLNIYSDIQLAQHQDVSTILEKIVAVSDLLITMAHKEIAANLLAFVIQHSDVNPKTREQAESLFDELEAELCPRVIRDAREFAHELTLEKISAHLQAID